MGETGRRDRCREIRDRGGGETEIEGGRETQRGYGERGQRDTKKQTEKRVRDIETEIDRVRDREETNRDMGERQKRQVQRSETR